MELQANFRQSGVSELIKTSQNEQGEVIVSGRELHEFLEVKTEYKDWFPRMVEYGFTQNEDFFSFEEEVGAQNRARTYIQKNHALKIDMAKQIAMIQRSDKGKEAREYFLKVESLWNSPEKVMERALQFAQKGVEEAKKRVFQLESVVEEQKPKVLYAEAVMASEDSIEVGTLSKLLAKNGINIGRNILFEWLRENGYLKKEGKTKNEPMQRYINQGWFEVVLKPFFKNDGTPSTGSKTMVTAKGQHELIKLFLKFNIKESN